MKTYTRNFVVFTLLLALCAGGLGYGFYKGKVEIQARAANAPTGTAAGTIGEYDLRC